MKNFKTFFVSGLNFKKLPALIILLLILSSEAKPQGMQVTQCAKDMVKGLDSLVKNLFVTSCNPNIKQHRTIFQSSCTMVGCGGLNQRYLWTYKHNFAPTYFEMFWHVQSGPPSYFAYYGLCSLTPAQLALCPPCAPVWENNVDWIRIKKIVGTSIVYENVFNITSIQNPRLATPLSPFWPFINVPAYNSLNSSMGILVDVAVGTNTYVGMIEHEYSNGYIKWKDNIPCPVLTNLTINNLVSTGSCSKIQMNVNISAGSCGDLYWDFGDGSPQVIVPCAPTGLNTIMYTYSSPGTYSPSAIIAGPGSCYSSLSSPITVTCSLPCTDCIPSFAPEAGKKYVISGWVKEGNASQATTTYVNPQLSIQFTPPGLAGPFSASGNIIDGWQRVEAEFLIPAGTTNMNIKLDCVSGNCFFDDIRVFPTDGSMKSYVYDPVTMRLAAELDERNYATLYEYDEEGKLIRVKKETEKGKMTIQENRNNTKKP